MRTFTLFVLILQCVLQCTARTFIDLTHQLKEGIASYPTHSKYTVTRHREDDPGWLAVNHFCLSEHSGTHLDAPYHFHQDKWYVHEIPLDHLVGPAVVVNISGRATQDNNAVLLTQDLISWERAHGPIPTGSIVFVFSGWDKHWHEPFSYMGTTPEQPMITSHPAISPEAAKWLVQNRRIVGVGIDTLSVDLGSEKLAPTHRIFAEANVYCLENVANLGLMPSKGATVHAFPLNIHEGTGSPARVVASFPAEANPGFLDTLSLALKFFF